MMMEKNVNNNTENNLRKCTQSNFHEQMTCNLKWKTLLRLTNPSLQIEVQYHLPFFGAV